MGLGSDGKQFTVTFQIKINTTNESALQTLTGIGSLYATRIVQYRLENGLFRDVDDLANIRGIGPVTMKKLWPYVTVE